METKRIMGRQDLEEDLATGSGEPGKKRRTTEHVVRAGESNERRAGGAGIVWLNGGS